jgi:hypothetical protein
LKIFTRTGPAAVFCFPFFFFFFLVFFFPAGFFLLVFFFPTPNRSQPLMRGFAANSAAALALMLAAPAAAQIPDAGTLPSGPCRWIEREEGEGKKKTKV